MSSHGFTHASRRTVCANACRVGGLVGDASILRAAGTAVPLALVGPRLLIVPHQLVTAQPLTSLERRKKHIRRKQWQQVYSSKSRNGCCCQRHAEMSADGHLRQHKPRCKARTCAVRQPQSTSIRAASCEERTVAGGGGRAGARRPAPARPWPRCPAAARPAHSEGSAPLHARCARLPVHIQHPC